MTRIKDIIQSLDKWAPPQYAESYDNVGLLVGNVSTEVTGVITSLDCTEAVVDEAVKKNCNLIVCHHPVIFKGIKKLTGNNYVERTIISAIKNDVAIYAIHTNLDNVSSGVNQKIAERIGLKDMKILQPKSGILEKLVVFVPIDHVKEFREGIFGAGGGNIGNYSNCSFNIEGEGTFKPEEGANPFSGEVGSVKLEKEVRVEIMYPSYLRRKIISAMRSSHPYEEVAYYVNHLENANQYIGSGMIGKLDIPMDLIGFLGQLKKSMELEVLKFTPLSKARKVETIAVCGGSGSFLLKTAKANGADVFITSDFKYHEFFDAENKISIVDIGHYESERFTIDLLAEYLRKNFSTFATHLTGVVTNPIQYF